MPNTSRNMAAIPSLSMMACGLSLCVAAIAADTEKLAEIDARYQAERAACERASASTDRAACLRDAAAARDEARRGVLGGASSDYEKNALARCDNLPPAERDMCIRRTRNEGETRGSVGEGGIYREYRELDLPPAAPAMQHPRASPHRQ